MQESTKLNILSLNVRGLRDQIKRRSIFSFLKDQKAEIFFLQEIYSEPSDETIWKMNGEAKYSSPMAPITAEVSAS